MTVKITPGNTDNRVTLRELIRNLSGKYFADKGYSGQTLF